MQTNSGVGGYEVTRLLTSLTNFSANVNMRTNKNEGTPGKRKGFYVLQRAKQEKL